MKKSRGVLFGFTILALVASSVNTAKAEATPASTANTQAVAPRLLDKVSVSYANVFIGPALTDSSSGLQPNVDTGLADPSAPLKLKNYLSTSYKLTDNTSASFTLYWINQARGLGMTLNDPYFKVGNSKLLSLGNFNLTADVRLAVPVSQRSRDTGLLTYVMSKQVSSYEIPNSRFSLSLTTYAITNLYKDAINRNAQDDDGNTVSKPFKAFEFYAGTSVDYKILPTLSAGLFYEMAAHHPYGNVDSMNNDGTDLEPNVSWDITPAINLNPYLDIKTGNRIALDTTQIGFLFSWKLL